jgi:prevent-host-death family protein
MLSIGTFEAKNKLSALLERVERGEEIEITRRGRPIARLVPARGARDQKAVRAAIKGLRELAATLNLGPFDWTEWKGMRDEGRP